MGVRTGKNGRESVSVRRSGAPLRISTIEERGSSQPTEGLQEDIETGFRSQTHQTREPANGTNSHAPRADKHTIVARGHSKR